MNSIKRNRIADILDKAADVIFVNGHTKDKLESISGEVCAVGSLNRAILGVANPWWGPHINFSDTDLVQDCVDILHEYLPESSSYEYSIVEWNNAPERRGEEVIEFFRSVAKELRNESPEYTRS